MLALQCEGCIMLLSEETDSDCKCSFWICRMVISGMCFSCTWQHPAVGSWNIWWFELPNDAFTLKSIRNQPFPLPPTAPLRSEMYWDAKSMSNMHLNALLLWRFIWYVLHVTLNIIAHCPKLMELVSVWSLQLNKWIVLSFLMTF